MLRELMRWNPAEELSSWHRDIDDLFDRVYGRREDSASTWVPRMETYPNDDGYVIRLDVPGVNPADIHVQSEGNVLTITGERKSEDKGSDHRETFYGRFERTVALPQGVEADKIAARYEHGVLEVKVPLPARLVGRDVPIQIEQSSNKKQLETKAA